MEQNKGSKSLTEALTSFAQAYKNALKHDNTRKMDIPRTVYIDHGDAGMVEVPTTMVDDGAVDKVDKSMFVGLLELMLRYAEVDVEFVRLQDDDTVVVWFTNGYKRKVNIEMDSYIAIVKDVLRAIG